MRLHLKSTRPGGGRLHQGDGDTRMAEFADHIIRCDSIRGAKRVPEFPRTPHLLRDSESAAQSVSR